MLNIIAALFAMSVAGCCSADLDGYEIISSQVELRSTDPMVPSEHFLVRSYGDHRIRIERVCGPEHCGTIAFLEYLTGEFPREPEVSTEIREISESVAAFVNDVVVVPSENGYSFDLIAENSYVGGPLFTLRVTPTIASDYTAVFIERYDGSEPEIP